jgi:hypothetical protein
LHDAAAHDAGGVFGKRILMIYTKVCVAIVSACVTASAFDVKYRFSIGMASLKG